MTALNNLKKLSEKKGFTLKLGSELEDFKYIGMGLPQFDRLGGAVSGHYDVIWGPTGCAKSTVCGRRIARAQEMFKDKIALVADAEDRAVAKWLAAQGADLSRLAILDDSCFTGVQGRATMEEYYDAIMSLVATGDVSYTVLDSISAMVPKAVIETSAGQERSVADDQVAADARKIQQFIKMSKSLFSRTKTACSIIAQVRTHGIGTAYARDGFSGGNMLRHMAVQIWHGDRGPRSEWEYEEVSVPGVKNKVKLLRAFPIRWVLDKDTGPNESEQCFARFVRGTGFDDFQSHIRAAQRLGVIVNKGSGRYTFIDSEGVEQKFHGVEKLDPYFKDPKEFEHLRKKNFEATAAELLAQGEDLEEAP